MAFRKVKTRDMQEYFKGHKDCKAINEYLNSLDFDSDDFQIVYCLRKIGESFVEGTLTLDTVSDYSRFIPASQQAESFIKQMKCFTFYSAICSIAQGKSLNPFEQKIKEEIENPTFSKPIPKSGKLALVKYKIERIWYTRWKHPLVYNEYWLPALITRIWSLVRGVEIVKD